MIVQEECVPFLEWLVNTGVICQVGEVIKRNRSGEKDYDLYPTGEAADIFFILHIYHLINKNTYPMKF